MTLPMLRRGDAMTLEKREGPSAGTPDPSEKLTDPANLANLSQAGNGQEAAEDNNPFIDWDSLDRERRTETDDQNLIAELAKLSRLQYAKRRREAATEIGISVGDLDKVVNEVKRVAAEEAVLFPHWENEPAAQPVDGDDLLRAVTGMIRRHVAMDDGLALVGALYTVMTWVHEDVAVHSPILLVTSALPNSGKTTLIKVLSFVARNGMSTIGITGPALFRSIKKWQPTMAVDEADTAFVGNDDLKEVFNSGWTRGEGVIRCDPDTNEPKMYSTFCPKVIGMIGRKLPAATMSRCLTVAMRRKRADEKVEDFAHIDNPDLARIRAMCLRWAIDNAEALRAARPETPPGVDPNRARMNWHLLLAIAERAGPEWKRRAWAAVKSVEEVNAAADPELPLKALSDICDAFDRRAVDRLATSALIGELAGDPEGPWASYGKGGKIITDRQLARLLRDFRRGLGIRPKTIRIGESTAKGYLRSDFEEDFTAYLPRGPISATPGVTPSQVNENKDLGGVSSVTSDSMLRMPIRNTRPDVTDKASPKPLKDNDCDAVTDKTPENTPKSTCSVMTCAHCGGADGPVRDYIGDGGAVWLHPRCADAYGEASYAARVAAQAQAQADDLDLPEILKR
jgi:Protein of unknown function (DUF3631)